MMHGEHSLNGLEFDDNSPIDDEIQPIAALDSDALVEKRERHLGTNMQSSNGEFCLQAEVVRTLESARPDDAMNFNGSIDNAPGNRIELRVCVPGILLPSHVTR